jgi:hypothetical protein
VPLYSAQDDLDSFEEGDESDEANDPTGSRQDAELAANATRERVQRASRPLDDAFEALAREYDDDDIGCGCGCHPIDNCLLLTR